MTVHLLALETSGSVCGVALISRRADGKTTVSKQEHDATGEHAERLLPMVDDLLAARGLGRRDLSAVAFGQGPGGFTGLRVACGVAQGMGFALQIPVVPVGSLMAVAQRDADAHPDHSKAVRVVVQDARMGEVYLAAYVPDEEGGWSILQAPMLLAAADLPLWLAQVSEVPHGLPPSSTLRLVGDGVALCPEIDGVRLGQGWLVEQGPGLRPDAATVGKLGLAMFLQGKHVTPEHAAPLYVRDKVAFTTRERQQGQGGNPKAPGLGVALRPMGPGDVPAVAAIEASVQAFPWTAGNFSDGLKAGYGGWVAHQHGRILGFSMTLYAPDMAHLLVLAVAPDAQREGVGTALIRHCEKEALARGLSDLLLEVRPSNLQALAFYRRHGFERIGIRKDYYPAPEGTREDGWVMCKTLVSGS
ncbi:tRNA (adenosine(37)-N6)-threonylcarbamoyltransferase complex dimerization subunit type 1 TsaB [Achromobacter sp. F4_2707]|uniref:tRNA (adenosine(37)-N6)-threonylcarbamoyltransferase complex dimerization subunit type 1 TsaB n=1 Tax=Achromobacter sp. F4_2707 TaxID=3114286 RepID=UPI0039C75C9E